MHAASPHSHDCAGDDHRHASHGARSRRGWRTERSARARSNWRLDVGDFGHLILRSANVQHSSPTPGRIRGEDLMSSVDQVPASRIEMPKRPTGARRAALWIAALLALVVLLAVGIIPRLQRHARAADTADAASVSLPNVLV